MRTHIDTNYRYSFYRGERCKHCGLPVPVFGLGHLTQSNEGTFIEKGQYLDETSQKQNKFFLFNDNPTEKYFLGRFLTLYEERFKGDTEFDVIGIAPSHEKGSYNSNLERIATDLGNALNVGVDPTLVKRVRTTAKQHELKSKHERVSNVHGSMEITEDVTGKNVLILDNTVITGATATEIFNILKERCAAVVVFFCVALGYKATEIDFDLNPNSKVKASEIMKWNWPKLEKSKRLLK